VKAEEPPKEEATDVMASFLSQSAQKGAVEEEKPEEEKTDIP